MKLFNVPTTRKTIEDYVAHCEQGLQYIWQAYRLLDKADEELQMIGEFTMPSELTFQRPRPDEIKQSIWDRAWCYTFDFTNLRQVMDAQAVREFKDTLEREPVPFTMDNVQATFLDMFNNAEALFQRGIVNVFRRLSADYRRHQDKPFEVPARIILRGHCERRFMARREVNLRATDTFDDIDRVFKTLDGEKYEPRALESALNAAWAEYDAYEDSYYKATAYKNGNVHMTFKRSDLLAKVNDLIADYYGDQTVGHDPAGRRGAA